MSADTRTVSPITALAGWPPGVRGRGSSMMMRPITPKVYPGFTCLAHPDTRYRSLPMRALRSFTVQPRLPERLAPLQALAMNLRWSWDDRTQDLFRWVDPDAWDATGHDPIRLLAVVDRRR